LRLKTYIAPTASKAMELVRAEMGEDAVIVSTRRVEPGEQVKVTAVQDRSGGEDAAYEYDAVAPADDALEQLTENMDTAATMRQALAYHGTPARLIDRLVAAAESLDSDNPTLAFAGALDSSFLFRPLSEGGEEQPIILVGPPGSGKTVTAAKLAARATLAGLSTGLITTDTLRAGGVAQLAAFANILQIALHTADSADELRRTVSHLSKGTENGRPDFILVDTQAANPFDDQDMEHLIALIKVADAEPVLVFPAGGDAMEAADMAVAFAALGVRRMLVTRLDLTRRLGSVLAAADAARLTFCDASITPHVANGLSTVNPVSLARLVIPRTADPDAIPQMTEAFS